MNYFDIIVNILIAGFGVFVIIAALACGFAFLFWILDKVD